MDDDFLLSVIVPIYNTEDYLERCVNSILDQSYRSTELILVDDGSTDRSGALCDAFAQRDGRVVVIHKENGGLSEARNTGLELSHGAYIAFVDSDDFLTEGALRELADLAKETDADIVQGSFVRFHPSDSIPEQPRERVVRSISAEEYSSAGSGRVYIWGKLLRRSIAMRYRFPVRHSAEDLYFNGLVISDPDTRRIVITNRTTYCYVYNPSSVSSNFRPEWFVDAMRTDEDLYEKVKAKSDNPVIVQNYLLFFFSQYCINKYNLILRGAFSPEIRAQFSADRKKHLRELFAAEIPLYKKLAYSLLSSSNALYRAFLIHRDPTVRVFEREQKERLKARETA